MNFRQLNRFFKGYTSDFPLLMMGHPTIPTKFLESFMICFTSRVALNGFEVSIREMSINEYLDIAANSENLLESPWLLKIKLACCAQERMIVC